MKNYSEIALNTLFERYDYLCKEKIYHGKWSYDIGVVLQGVKEAYEQTGDKRYFDYIQNTMDFYIDEDGRIKNYQMDAMNIDYINNGKCLFLLYKETGVSKYKIALDTLYQQLQQMPRTSEGGFWHKKIYPYQMWLDGLYMGAPFLTEYALTFKKAEALADVIKQFTLINNNPYVSEEKRRRILAVMKEVNYIPNYTARALSVGKTKNIGVILPFVNHPYFDRLLSGITTAAFARGYKVTLLATNYDPQVEEAYLQEFAAKSFDALIIASRANPIETLLPYRSYGRIVFCENIPYLTDGCTYIDREPITGSSTRLPYARGRNRRQTYRSNGSSNAA